MRPSVTSWVRNTATKWMFRFFCRRLKRNTNPPPPSVVTLKEIKLHGVRADWFLVSAEGIGVGVMQRRQTSTRWTVLGMHPAVRVLPLCRPVASVTPADFGLPSLIAQRADDGVKVYFGERDDMTAFLVDA